MLRNKQYTAARQARRDTRRHDPSRFGHHPYPRHQRHDGGRHDDARLGDDHIMSSSFREYGEVSDREVNGVMIHGGWSFPRLSTHIPQRIVPMTNGREDLSSKRKLFGTMWTPPPPTPESVSRGVNSNNSIARSNNVVESSASRSASRPTVSREVAVSVSARCLEFESMPTEVDQTDTQNDNDMQIADTNDTITQRDDGSDMVAASSSRSAAPPIRHSVTDETKQGGNNNMESEDEEMEVVNNSNTTIAQSTQTGRSTHSDMDDEMEDDLFGQVESRATESTQASPSNNTQDTTQIEEEIDHSTVFEAPKVDIIRPAIGLPHGWTTKTYHRKTGKTAGRAYHMYYSPKKNKKFPSMVQAKEYIKILSQPDIDGDEDVAWEVFQAKRETMKAERKALKQEAAASAQLTNNEPAVELPLPDLDPQETRGLLDPHVEVEDTSTQTFQPPMVQLTQQTVREASAYVAPLGAEIILAKASDRVGAKEDQAILISDVQDYLTCSDNDLVSIQWLSTREVVEIPKSWTRPCPERRSASNKPSSYEDLDDDKISSMMSTDDADAIEKATKAKAASMKAKKKKMRKKKKKKNSSSLLVVEERGRMFYHKKKKGTGKFIIEGHWNFKGRPSPSCQRFRLVHTLTEGQPPAILPKEAIFHGSFEGKGRESYVKEEERDVHLSFTQVEGDPNVLAVNGRGKNQFGSQQSKAVGLISFGMALLDVTGQNHAKAMKLAKTTEIRVNP